MESERQLQAEKRKQEKEYLQRMLQENEQNKVRQKNEDEQKRLDDFKSQEEYSKMLEKQELDRVNEMKRREARAQEFQNKMADNVLSKMDAKQKFEDDMLQRYENEREMRHRQMEERRTQRAKAEQEKMRNFLSQQVTEKASREKNDKENIDQQARMWELDKKNYEEEEKRLKERINKINMDNSQYLQNQMAAKHRATAKMNNMEMAINKPLLREVNQKLKAASNYEGNGSIKSSQQQSQGQPI